MNMREIVINRILTNENISDDKYLNNLKALGFIDHKRTIQLFIKEIDKINGIPDRKVQEIAALMTNYSITNINNNSKLYNKTVYFCDVEFPRDLDKEAIIKNIENFIEIAYIRPTYAFQTAHIINSDGYIDLGLTMCDLSVSGTCGIVNFSDNEGEFPKYKDYVYTNSYNPRFYNNIDNSFEIEKKRSGNISEFVDDRTSICCNMFGTTTVENFINDKAKTGIYINNRTRTLNEFINSIFQKLLHIGLEKFEIVIRRVNNNVEFNIIKCGFYAKLDDGIKQQYISEIYEIGEKEMTVVSTKLDDSDFYLIYSFNTKFAILDYFYNDEVGNKRETRISKPIYHLYNEFSLDTEDIINNIELNGEIVKADMIETMFRNNTSNLDNSQQGIQAMINYIDSITHTIVNQIETVNEGRARLSMDDPLWQKNLPQSH